MRLDIITLFPGMFAGPLTESIIARAQKRGLVDLRLVDLRQFATDARGTVDDRPFGGGAGMVLKPEPLCAAVESVRTPQARVLLMTPQGAPFRQRAAERLSRLPHLILVCGHYEGVDERFRQALVDEEISLGDFVLTNGSLPAMLVADAVIRLLPGALGSPESAVGESFGADGLLEYPQYTRPEEFRGMRVPEVLLSGDHGRIAGWRQEQQVWRTMGRRPDLLTEAQE
ncbi:MAG: tRNA (guanosine(37)-N1)-methyltransferase TrmD [Lentisphaeria bacterium]